MSIGEIAALVYNMSSQWYLAELVMEITVADDPRNVIHRNMTLISAQSADEAYDKSLTIGHAGETSYLNPAGKSVSICFRGIADIDRIYDELEDGAELTFHASVGVPEDDVKAMLHPRDRLTAFLHPQRAAGPDYASAEVIEQAEREFGVKRPE